MILENNYTLRRVFSRKGFYCLENSNIINFMIDNILFLVSICFGWKMFYFARAAPSIDLHAEQLVERMRWTWWTPFYVYPIRLLLISRTACFHLARLSLLLTSTHLSCVRLPTARFRRDRIKTFFFFLFSLHFLRQRAIKWKYFFFFSYFFFNRSLLFPSSRPFFFFPFIFYMPSWWMTSTYSRLHEPGLGDTVATHGQSIPCHARFVSRTVCFVSFPFFFFGVQFSG